MADLPEIPNSLGKSSDSKARTLTSAAYHRLRSDIVDGKLTPNQKLRVEHLKKDYDVGAGTLREALALLVADALVVSRQQRGFWVAPMSVSDFRDITETRAILESQAIRLSIQNGDDEWEAQLSAAFHMLSRAEERLNTDSASVIHWENCNREFHEILVSRCDSRWLKHFLEILYRQSERYRRFAVQKGPSDRNVHAEHSAIFEACLARDASLASSHIEDHIRKTLDVVIQVSPDLDE